MTFARRALVASRRSKLPCTFVSIQYEAQQSNFNLFALRIGRILSANKQILPKKLADPPPLSATASSRTMFLCCACVLFGKSSENMGLMHYRTVMLAFARCSCTYL